MSTHLKAFDRNEAMKRFKENKKALLEYDLQGADLRGADLRGADLRGADLQGADLQDANLQDADLQGADLQDANLQDANLWNANLRGANLQDANLWNANLWNADLRNADLDYSCLPLWCGSLKTHFDDRQLIQLTYHLVSAGLYSKNASESVKDELSKLINLANKFHRADVCGKIDYIKEKEND